MSQIDYSARKDLYRQLTSRVIHKTNANLRTHALKSIRKDQREKAFSLKRVPGSLRPSGYATERVSSIPELIEELWAVINNEGAVDEVTMWMCLLDLHHLLTPPNPPFTDFVNSKLPMTLEKIFNIGSIECVRLAAYCVASIAALIDEPVNELLGCTVCLMRHFKEVENLEALQAITLAIGNLSILFHDEVAQEEIIAKGVRTLGRLLSSWYSETCRPEATGTMLWFICNTLRSHDMVVCNTFVEEGGIQVFQSFLQLSMGYSSPEEVHCFEVEDERFLHFKSQLEDAETRHLIGEVIWCLLYVFETDERFSELLNNQAFWCVLINIQLAAFPLLDSPLPPSSSSSGGITADTSSFASGSKQFRKKRQIDVELIFPALQILRNFCHELKINDLYAFLEMITKSPKLKACLESYLRINHRGIQKQTIFILGRVAAGTGLHTDFVLPFLNSLAEILNLPGNFDIKMGVIIALIELSINHEMRYLDRVLEVTPPIAVSVLNVVDTCRMDFETVSVALDFLELALIHRRELKRLLYAENAIVKLEAAQFLHENLERRISRIVEEYFDDCDVDISPIDSVQQDDGSQNMQ